MGARMIMKRPPPSKPRSRPSRPPAAENAGKTGGLRQEGDGPSKRGRDGTGQNVTISDMPQLVRQHALKFFVIEKVQDALGHRDSGVLRVATGSKGVG